MDQQSLAAAQNAIAAALARHTSYLHRVSTGTVNDITRVVDESASSLAAQLHELLDALTVDELSAFQRGQYTTYRLVQLRNAIDEWCDQLNSDIGSIWYAAGLALVRHESTYVVSIMRRVVHGLPTVALEAAGLYQRAVMTPVLGELVEDMLAGIAAGTRKRIYSTIRQGVADGQTNAALIKALRGTKALKHRDGALQATRNEAARVVRTARNYLSNVAYEDTYAALGVEYVMVCATLDGRTSKYCAAHDGTVYEVGTNYPRPPYHPHCRTVLVPKLDDKLLSMGVRPYLSASKPVSKIPRDQRPEGMIGQVSASTTYADWFGRQSAAFQREWLGASRYKLYREGGYTIDRFVDPQQGRQYTLEQLRQRDQQTFDDVFG